jgi:hypothetical protein
MTAVTETGMDGFVVSDPENPVFSLLTSTRTYAFTQNRSKTNQISREPSAGGDNQN